MYSSLLKPDQTGGDQQFDETDKMLNYYLVYLSLSMSTASPPLGDDVYIG